MAVKKSNRPAGRPSSAGMSAESIKGKIEHELTKANRNAANNLGKYFAIMESYALGTAKNCSPTNQVSSCKMFVEMAEKYLDDAPDSVEDPDEQDEVVEGKKVSGDTVLSYTEKKEAWSKLQAEKKLKEE